MAQVQVIQRHAHLAGAVKFDRVNGGEGKIARAVLTAISNTRRGPADAREEETTALQWTLWGKQAENAAQYLGKGSHVNIVGRLRNDHYLDAEGSNVYALAFTVDEIDYLDSRAQAEARQGHPPRATAPETGTNGAGRRPASQRQPAQA